MKKRFFAGFAAAAIAASMMAVPVGASTTSFTYTPVSGGDFVFNKYLVVDDNATVPKATFTYTIAPAGITTAHLTAGNVELYNGAAGAVMKTSDPDAQFTSASATATGAASFTNNKGVAGSTINILDSMTGKKYATDTVTVDFSACSFNEPGVYRYTLTETAVAAPYSHINAAVRTLDVYVQDTGTALEVTGYVLYDSDIGDTAPTNYSASGAETGIGYNTNENDTATGKKSSGFVNGYETVDLTVSKAVTGNQGSRDKYFKFTIKSNTTLEETDKFYLSGNFEAAPTATSATSYATADMAVTANGAVLDTDTSTYYVTGATLNTGYVIYMQAGQNVVVNGLPKGVSYTVTEDAEDYTPSTAVSGDTTNDGTDLTDTTDNVNIASGSAVTVSDTNLTADTTVAYTNNRTGTIPTGVILTVAAPAVIGLGVLGLIVMLNVKKKREDAEE